MDVSEAKCYNQLKWNTPRTRVCAIYRTPLGCNVNLIRSDLFIYPSRRSGNIILIQKVKILKMASKMAVS